MEGVFQDEHGDYPAGSYFRNPPGTSHVPASSAGCTLFVRLWQFREADKAQIVRQCGEGQNVGPRPGARSATILFDDGHETVRLEDWSRGGVVTGDNVHGLEFLVVSGSLTLGDETLEPLSWGRLPAGTPLNASVGPQDARIWIKDAPLLFPGVCRLDEPG